MHTLTVQAETTQERVHHTHSHVMCTRCARSQAQAHKHKLISTRLKGERTWGLLPDRAFSR